METRLEVRWILRIKQATTDRPTLCKSPVFGGNTPIAGGRQSFTINSVAGMRFGPNTSPG